jgi:hypothetical protein
MSETRPLTDAELDPYAVEFCGPKNESAWWSCYFTEVAEATRWAEWELERIVHGEPGWRAEVLAGQWQAGHFLSHATVATVGPE